MVFTAAVCHATAVPTTSTELPSQLSLSGLNWASTAPNNGRIGKVRAKAAISVPSLGALPAM